MSFAIYVIDDLHTIYSHKFCYLCIVIVDSGEGFIIDNHLKLVQTLRFHQHPFKLEIPITPIRKRAVLLLSNQITPNLQLGL